MSGEAMAFLLSAGCGFFAIALLGARSAIGGGWVLNIIADLLWWIISAGVTAFCLWQTVSAELRIFYAIALFLGGILAYFTIMKPMERLTGLIIKIVYKIIEFILKILLTPWRFLYKILVVDKMHKVCKKTRKAGNYEHNEKQNN